VMDTTIAKI